jgi:uncharacterized protein
MVDEGRALELTLLYESLAVCRLDPHAAIPGWATGAFVSITRAAEELSIVCAERDVPPDAQAERGWRALVVAGPLAFSLTGVLAALATPLAAAGIPIFAISTFDTDYVLVRSSDVAAAINALRSAGHRVRDAREA